MTDNQSIIVDNIQHILHAKSMNVAELSRISGVEYTSLSSIMRKKRRIGDSLLLRIARALNLDIDSLKSPGYPIALKEDEGRYQKPPGTLQTAEATPAHEPPKVDTEIWINSYGNKFTKIDDDIFIEAPLVIHEAYARFLDEVSEARVFESERTVAFVVEKFDNSRYMAFRVYGDSMSGGKINDTPDKAVVLGREVPKSTWLDGGLKNAPYGFVILNARNILYKDILSVDVSRATILCHSRNPSPEYADFELSLNEVNQIFKIVKRTF